MVGNFASGRVSLCNWAPGYHAARTLSNVNQASAGGDDIAADLGHEGGDGGEPALRAEALDEGHFERPAPQGWDVPAKEMYL